QAGVFGRIPEEIHDLDELVLGFVDTRDIVERNSRVLLLVVAARLALADTHEPAPEPPALLGPPPKQPDVKPDEEERRSEPEHECRPRALGFPDRLGADLDAVG